MDAISTALSTIGQISFARLTFNVGSIPMVGVNDGHADRCSLTNEQALKTIADGNAQIAWPAMWLIARDNGSGAGPR